MKNYGDRGGCYRPRWITASEISIILHMIRKPNSVIVLLFFQHGSQFKNIAKTCLPPSMFISSSIVYVQVCPAPQIFSKQQMSPFELSSCCSCHVFSYFFAQFLQQAYGQFSARGGGKPFAQKILASCPNFYTRAIRCNNIGRTGIRKCLNTVFQGQYIPAKLEHKLYVAINKHLEKLPPQLYQIKMKICRDQGCNDIGVVIATKGRHYLLYLEHYFSM